MKLITATRLPARHVRLVKVHIDGIRHLSLVCLESAEQLKSNGLVKEAALEPNQELCVCASQFKIVVMSLCLKTGEILSQLQPVTLVEDAGHVGEKL